MSTANAGPMPALQNLDAEAEVVGAIFRRPEKLADVMQIVQSSDFSSPRCQQIFAAQTELAADGKPVNYVAVGEILKARSMLDAETVQLMERLDYDVLHAEGAVHAAQIVRQYAQLRELYLAGRELERDIIDRTAPPDEILSRHERRLSVMQRHAKADDLFGSQQLASMFLDELERRRSGKSCAVKTGFVDLDRDLGGGLWAGQLVILAARTSVGKTALSWQIAVNAAERSGRPAVFASAEMPPIELIEREFSRQARVDSNILRNGQLSQDEARAVAGAFDGVASCNVIVGDARGASIAKLRSQARRAIMRHGALSLIVVDYLQFVQPDDARANRNEQVAGISRSLKALAAEADCPVLALSQLNRLAERREGHRPQLSDLRDSGAIEQDSDVCLLIYRPEVHNPTDRPGEADLIIAKNRNGPLGETKLTFIKEQTRFENHYPAFEHGSEVGANGF